MRFTIAALCVSTMFGLGCESKEYKNCLTQVDEYQKKVVECGKMTDEAQKADCLSKADVGKMTREDCDSSFK